MALRMKSVELQNGEVTANIRTATVADYERYSDLRETDAEMAACWLVHRCVVEPDETLVFESAEDCKTLDAVHFAELFQAVIEANKAEKKPETNSTQPESSC